MTFTATAHQYARDVVAGKLLACKWVRLACQRHLDDLEHGEKRGLYFDEEAADRACRFISLLPHIKGEWARRGEKIKLEPWQTWIVASIFGWKRKDGTRRFRIAYVEVARKNAKSTLAAAIGLYMLAADGEAGAEVYSAATTRDQAKIVWSVAQAMAKKEAGLRRHFGVEAGARSIYVEASVSKFEPLSAEDHTLEGLNPHCAVIDELHAHKTRAVYDVMESATGARQQPLLFIITTAGSDRLGICYEQRTYVTKILGDVLADDSYFGAIYTLDEGDDWTDRSVWMKANPNLGVSVYEDDLERLAAKAQTMATAQNNFLTKRLDVWVHADTAWMNMQSWAKCGGAFRLQDLGDDLLCWMGLDLASKVDIACLSLLFRDLSGHYWRLGRYYLPESVVEEGQHPHADHYAAWSKAGLLTLTPGNVIDLDLIEQDIYELGSEHGVISVGYDPWQATQLATHLMERRVPMVEVIPGVRSFSEPMKSMEGLVAEGKWHHGDDPVLRWMVSNVVAHRDNKDNIYPRKERAHDKIDGVIADLMALSRALVQSPEPTSVYEERGVMIV